MKSVLLSFIGVCAVRATAGNLKAQTVLGDTETRVTGGRPPASDAVLPTVTRKFVQINGMECEWSPPGGQDLLIGR